MTKTLLAGLLLIASAFTARSYTTQASAEPDWRYAECRYQSLQKGTWTPREERLTASCAIGHWSVSGGLSKFLQVENCESGGNRFASNGGRYVGLFQHSASAYRSRIASFQPNTWDKPLDGRWWNSRGHIVMTARMVHAGGWSAWTCA